MHADDVDSNLSKPVGELQNNFHDQIKADVDDDTIDIKNQDEAIEDEIIDEVEAEELSDSQKEIDQSSDAEDSKPQAEEEIDEVAEEFMSPEDFSDQETDRAIKEIAEAESDQVLVSSDNQKKIDVNSQSTKKSFKQKLGSLFKRWWNNPLARYGTLGALFVLIVGCLLLPNSRYWLLNTAGVRVKSSFRVVENDSERPVSGAIVSLGGKFARSDEEGNVNFSGLKQGKNQLTIEKRGFGNQDRNVVLGWGSNPLGNQSLEVTGTQYTFFVKDWLSDKPLESAKAAVAGVDALIDDEGKIVLTVPQETADTDQITITSEGYRDAKFAVGEIDSKVEQQLKMVPAKKHVFISKRAGRFDVFKIDVDGKNEELLLKATGKERDTISVIPHESGEVVALTSTRDNDRNKDGYVLDGLFIVNVNSGDIVKVSRSEQINVVGWEGDKLVYSQIVEGTSGANPNRSKIISYDYRATTKQDLASANYFNSVLLFNNKVYYAVSSYAVPASSAKFFRIDVDGKGQIKLLDKEVWSIYQVQPDELYLNASNSEWYEVKASSTSAVKISEQPNDQDSRRYVSGPGENLDIWVDYRDGKSVLLIDEGDTDRTLTTASGITYPIRWLSNKHVIYRIQDGRENADYIINIDGGSPQKITDVSSNNRTNSYF